MKCQEQSLTFCLYCLAAEYEQGSRWKPSEMLTMFLLSRGKPDRAPGQYTVSNGRERSAKENYYSPHYIVETYIKPTFPPWTPQSKFWYYSSPCYIIFCLEHRHLNETAIQQNNSLLLVKVTPPSRNPGAGASVEVKRIQIIGEGGF